MDRNSLIFVIALATAAILLLRTGLPFTPGLAVIVAAAVVLWLVSLVVRNAGIVDVTWGPGFVLVGAFYLWSAPADPGARAWLVFLLTTLWAARLAIHLGRRNFGVEEDFRYRSWRAQAGASFWWISLFKVFLLQAVVLWVVSSPLLLAHGTGPAASILPFDLVGVTLFAAGFLIESIADRQLERFKRDPANRGRVLDTGLWGRSRHPNYFGEAVLWWGLGLLAVPTGGWLALVGPALITFLLVRISGVTMLEDTLRDRKPGYAAYIASTPAFVPRIFRRGRSENSN
jgi:steroid 5-alpha reductase family enzyme